ncbi:TonB-dependent receptor [Glaciecola sp. 1036]|uniref:TonB-dependent receptor n=1 Tax=Alteromonadaceae TaxID=72275 RepID=UPI003D01749C
MFKKKQLATAVIIALSSSLLQAQEETDTSISENDDNVEVIEVTGIRASLNKAINIKRQNIQIVDAIVAEDIGKFPDNNVVEALQRVSGVQVTDRTGGEVSTVSIRGLTDVTTTVNGRNIFTSVGRSIALADIPAALLESASVYKTRSASQLGSGLAGQIDVSTQRPFNFDDTTMVFAARGIEQEQQGDIDPNVSFLVSTRWDTDLGEFGALLNVAYARTRFRDQSLTAGAMLPYFTKNPPETYRMLRRVPGDFWTAGLEEGLSFDAGATLDINGENAEYYLSRDAIFGIDTYGDRKRPATSVSFQWAPNDWSEYLFEAFYNGFRTDNKTTMLFKNVEYGYLLPPDTPLYLFEGTNIVKAGSALDSQNIGNNFSSSDFFTGKTDGYLYALGGRWDFTDNLRVESEVVYQTSEYSNWFFAMRGTPASLQGILNFDFNAGDGLPSLEILDNPATAGIDESDITNPSNWLTNSLYDNNYLGEGDALTFTIDAEQYVEFGIFEKIAYGFRYDKRTAQDYDYLGPGGNIGAPLSDFAADFVFLNTNFMDGNAYFPSSWAGIDAEYIANNRQEIRALHGYDDVTDQTPTLNFDIEEVSTEAYFEADFNTTLAGKKIDGQVGVRIESADREMFFDGTEGEGSSTSVLPSLVVRYHLSEDLLARIAYTETVRRPDFAALNPTINYGSNLTGLDLKTAGQGNPDLGPVESVNIDLSLEWYFAPESSVYAAWFQRDIEGFVFDQRRLATLQGPEDEQPTQYVLTQPGNTSDGKLQGWEFGAVYFPDGLPDILDGIGVQASYTLLDSNQIIREYDVDANGDIFLSAELERSMFGVSDNSYSIVGIYEKDNFDMRLSYVWRDDFINNYEAALFANPRPVYRRPEESLNFQLSYEATENLMFTFDATNITDEIYQSYYQYPNTHNFGSALVSRTFAVGVRYRM